MESDILDDVNPFQKEAVTHPEGPVLALAGAGSGKTRIITYRIAYLIKEKGVSPTNILAVTFTNKAANEMKERVHRLVARYTHELWIGTFHSVCLRILKKEIDKLEGFRRDFIIYDEVDQIKLRRLNALDYGQHLDYKVMLFDRRPEVLEKYQCQFQHKVLDQYQDTNYSE